MSKRESFAASRLASSARGRWDSTRSSVAPDAMAQLQQLGANEALLAEEGAAEVVDRLFDLVDHDVKGRVTKEDLMKTCGVIRDDAFMGAIGRLNSGRLSSVEGGDEEDGGGRAVRGFTREQLCDALFGVQAPSFSSNLLFINLLWLLPMFYSATTRLPFICVALEILDKRDGELWQVGVVLGVFQTCRSISNFIISAFGGSNPMGRLQIPMLLVGLAGWVYVLLSSEDVWNLLALGGVGLAEIIVNLQTSTIRETQLQSPSRIADPEILSNRLRVQYASVACGSFLAYILGGAFFTYFGFDAVCYLGIALVILQLILSAAYLIQSKTNVKTEGVGPVHDCFEGIDVRKIIYKIEALRILDEEAESAFEHASGILSEDGDVTKSSKHWSSDRTLQKALNELHGSFFEATSCGLEGMMSAYLEVKSERLSSTVKSEQSSSTPGRRRPSLLTDMARVSSCLMIRSPSSNISHVSQEDFVSYLAPRVFYSVYGSEQKATVQVVWQYMKLVVATQATMALCIGTFLSTALLLYTKKFNKKASSVGIFLGIGEGLGSLSIFAPSLLGKLGKRFKITERVGSGTGFFATIVSRPLHVIAILFVLSSATVGYTSNSFHLAVVFQLIMSGVNDLSVTLLNEMIATSLPADQFRKMQGLGQWLRRLGNMLTGVMGPILFGIDMDLPFLTFGCIVFAWTIILWYFMWAHARRMKVAASRSKGSSLERGPISAFSSSIAWHERERRYYAVNMEVLDRELLGRQDLSSDIDRIEFRVRKLNAALNAEQAKRRKLEEKLDKFLQRVVPQIENEPAVINKESKDE